MAFSLLRTIDEWSGIRGSSMKSLTVTQEIPNRYSHSIDSSRTSKDHQD